MERPSPRPAPVTIAVLPESVLLIILFSVAILFQVGQASFAVAEKVFILSFRAKRGISLII
jgi:hypothetical protein